MRCTRSGARSKTDDKVNKKRKITHPPSSTTADPPSLPSSIKTPFLPVEVLENILDKLHADKHTLAQCMRVSTTFNTIATPILYRTLVIKSGKVAPYSGLNVMNMFRWPPIKSRRHANNKLFTNVIIGSTGAASSEKTLLKGLSKVRSVRLPLSILNSKAKSNYALAQSQQYRPGKLVIHSATTNTASIQVPGFADLHTLVFLISPTYDDKQFLRPPATPPCSPHIKRIVQIFWTDVPCAPCGVRPQATARRHRPKDPLLGHLPSFTIGVTPLIQYHSDLEDIIIVNAGSILPGTAYVPRHFTRQEISAKVQAVVKTALATTTGYTIDEPLGHLVVKYGNRVVNIRFIPLREYLNTYDWSGEFTEEEVKPWLKDQTKH